MHLCINPPFVPYQGEGHLRELSLQLPVAAHQGTVNTDNILKDKRLCRKLKELGLGHYNAKNLILILPCLSNKKV
jgi:hypothetical protein